jgi:hypothetical protein
MDRYKEAYSAIELILNIKPNKKNDFDGHLFRFTLKCFKETAEKMSSKSDFENSQNLISLSSSRFFKHDIFEYCTRINQK